MTMLLFTTAADAEAPGPSFGNPFRFTEAGGAAVYDGLCAGCHMQDGRGAVGAARYPALADDPRLAAATYSITRVLKGRGAMPPFARSLSDEQVADVISYIRTNFGNHYAEPVGVTDVASLR